MQLSMNAKAAELAQLSSSLILIAVFYFALIPLGITDPEGMSIDEGLPPSFSPRLLALIAAVIVIARMLRLFLQGNSAAATPDTSVDFTPDNVTFSTRVILGVFMALVYAFILMPTLGFIIASLLLLLVTLIILGERDKIRLIAFPCVVTLGVWLLFSKLLSVHLPTGMLFDA